LGSVVIILNDTFCDTWSGTRTDAPRDTSW
jgi:hypothetical protein